MVKNVLNLIKLIYFKNDIPKTTWRVAIVMFEEFEYFSSHCKKFKRSGGYYLDEGPEEFQERRDKVDSFNG